MHVWLIMSIAAASRLVACLMQESGRIESEMQDAVSAVQRAAGQKRPSDALAMPDAYNQLHVDKRVKLEV